jgi:hypothetical protein
MSACLRAGLCVRVAAALPACGPRPEPAAQSTIAQAEYSAFGTTGLALGARIELECSALAGGA